jgi:putative membrane protein
VSAGDRNFVEESLSAGMAEVELGRMAQQRATSPEVKQFAEMMVRDHTQAGDSLRQVAQQHAIDARAEIQDRHRDLMDRLSNLKGADFDREYMDAMVDSHQSMINHLQSRADQDRFGENKGAVTPEPSDNPVEASLNQWAATALPTTQKHLDEARRVSDGLNNRGATRQY